MSMVYAGSKSGTDITGVKTNDWLSLETQAMSVVSHLTLLEASVARHWMAQTTRTE